MGARVRDSSHGVVPDGPVDALMYSVSVTLSVTELCVLDNHPAIMPPSVCTFPETLRRSVLSVA
jgi:hypothetical protein